MSKVTAEEAMSHIESLYPPDSKYDETRAIGQQLMATYVGNSVGYSNWRELPDNDLLILASVNLEREGERGLAAQFKAAAKDPLAQALSLLQRIIDLPLTSAHTSINEDGEINDTLVEVERFLEKHPSKEVDS